MPAPDFGTVVFFGEGEGDGLGFGVGVGLGLGRGLATRFGVGVRVGSGAADAPVSRAFFQYASAAPPANVMPISATASSITRATGRRLFRARRRP
ncbi:hypothetical protein [Streptomyces solicathayae]|uniref:hypothetical protein n=1 Tax=Streptomyces solicathayae TaxID=3081768 RepID=UPI00398CB0C5